MCSFSHELLAYFLHDREYVLMTNMLGSYLNIQGFTFFTLENEGLFNVYASPRGEAPETRG